jgi:hypothetical protein
MISSPYKTVQRYRCRKQLFTRELLLFQGSPETERRKDNSFLQSEVELVILRG